MVDSIKLNYENYTKRPFEDCKLIFIQDNATVHTKNLKDKEKKSAKSILNDNGIELEDWPPYSPDLNPVENVWSMLNRIKNDQIDKIIKYNETNEIKIKLPVNKFEMFKFMKNCWSQLDNNGVVNCYNSYLSRLEMCIKVRGDNNFDYSRKRK